MTQDIANDLSGSQLLHRGLEPGPSGILKFGVPLFLFPQGSEHGAIRVLECFELPLPLRPGWGGWQERPGHSCPILED